MPLVGSAHQGIRWEEPTGDATTTVHATTKSFIPFCSAQDGESADTNCLVVLSKLRKWQIFDETPSL